MMKDGNTFGSRKGASDEVKSALHKKEKAERRELARNKNAPVEILAELANDDDWEVRKEVGRNKNSPAVILEKLAGDDDWRVREGVAWNEKASGEVLEKLASDRCEVRYAVLMNKHAPIGLVKRIELENEREDAERKKSDTGDLREMRGRK